MAKRRKPATRPTTADRRPHSSTFWWTAWVTAGVAVVLVGTTGTIRSNSSHEAAVVQQVGGDAERAIPAMIRNGCGGCHEIPGVPGAHGSVGPSLQGVAERAYIGGHGGRTSSDAMMRWISRARDVDPKTAMPNTNLSPQEARDITAYLYART
ncbi:c-type cytochrome [Mesorhizobium sp.]|nr:c-type cytochrome [Mesorhizobium sp.]AZO25599.1 c-type cytochrome [Mesorhizobium sp. M1E.F.Ca.ET.045.02.1.1]RUW38493.1 c-type cytochrome [Mesorhizobium sp. M1E.F.Ca.ET.041.01.1.1]RUW83735.1 c-type cytochrome [Mesorhizobium sp. M1E.F.Ca.ET.063.01.1.1]RWB57249.1 MAG: c-type cytochrome [Mesorhizobium sp.]RWD90566.1 MAG: c-type cytochrome [Mesorhizobium sp.]